MGERVEGVLGNPSRIRWSPEEENVDGASTKRAGTIFIGLERRRVWLLRRYSAFGQKEE